MNLSAFVKTSADAAKLVSLSLYEKFRNCFKYIKRYPALVSLYFFFNILSAIFSLVSLVMLAPFLQVIFKVTETANNQISSRFSIGPLKLFYDWLTQLVNTEDGKIKALAAICIVVLVSIILK